MRESKTTDQSSGSLHCSRKGKNSYVNNFVEWTEENVIKEKNKLFETQPRKVKKEKKTFF